MVDGVVSDRSLCLLEHKEAVEDWQMQLRDGVETISASMKYVVAMFMSP